MIEVYIKSLKSLFSDDYILTNHQTLLPDWRLKPQTIIFIFFKCQVALDRS